MIELTHPEVKFAVEAVQKASQLVRLVQRETVTSALTKGDKSPVTIADFASQALVSQMLSTRFPDAVMVGEESSAQLKAPESAEMLAQITSFVRRFVPDASPDSVCEWIDLGSAESAPRFWTLDPIDGTKGFLRGDQYAVAFALVENGQVQIGVLGCPNLTNGYKPEMGGPGSLVLAVRGQGTWTTSLESPGEWTPLKVSPTADPSQTRIMRSFESGHTDADKIDEFAAKLGTSAEPVRMDSQAKYAVMAAGQGEIILRLLSPKQPDYREKIWDQAAGSLILEEAGGRISDLSGKPLDFTQGRMLVNNRGVLASNGALHEAALAALAAVGA